MEPPPRRPGFVRPEKTGSPQSQEEPTIVCACAWDLSAQRPGYDEGQWGPPLLTEGGVQAQPDGIDLLLLLKSVH
jgi:hypothetical protein